MPLPQPCTLPPHLPPPGTAMGPTPFRAELAVNCTPLSYLHDSLFHGLERCLVFPSSFLYGLHIQPQRLPTSWVPFSLCMPRHIGSVPFLELSPWTPWPAAVWPATLSSWGHPLFCWCVGSLLSWILCLPLPVAVVVEFLLRSVPVKGLWR